MHNGYERLYEAIWKQAVEDDISETLKKLKMETIEAIFPDILKYPKAALSNPTKVERAVHEQYGIAGKIGLQKLEIELDKNKEEMKTAVKNKVYKETHKWPDNSKAPDKNFEAQFYKVKQRIIANYQEV